MKKQQDKFEHYIVELETLTPLHIGSGISFTKDIDFFVEKGKVEKVGKVNPEKILGIIGAKPEMIDIWVKYIEDEDKKSIRALPQLSSEPLEKLCDEILEVRENVNVAGQLDEFIRNQYTKNPIIPGSSLKGAIRTAYLTSVIIGNHNKLREKFKNELKGLKARLNGVHDRWRRKRMISSFAKMMHDFVFTYAQFQYDNIRVKADAQKDIFKFFRISDGEGNLNQLKIDNFCLLNYRYNKNNKRNEWQIDNNRRTKSAEVFEGKVSLTITIQKDFWNKNKLGLKNIEDFIRMLNNHTERLVDYQIKFFKDEYFSKLGVKKAVKSNLNCIKEQITNTKSNEAILRVGQGSGWDFITGGWAKDGRVIPKDYDWYFLVEKLLRKKPYDRSNDPPPFPKTRRVTSKFLFPGFVKLKFNKINYENIIS